MGFFKVRFVAPIATRFWTYCNACKKFFSKKTAKNSHASPGLQVAPVATSKNCVVEVDKILQAVHEETVEPSVVLTTFQSEIPSPLVEQVTCEASQNVVDSLAPRPNPWIIDVSLNVCNFS